jgi:hypothetical protein
VAVRLYPSQVDAKKGELAIEFIDDIIHLAKGKIFNAAYHKIVNIFNRETEPRNGQTVTPQN